jgi:Starch-binding associating with outer membrane
MKMKKKIFSWALAIGTMSLVSCDKQAFVDLNTNPDVLYSVKPEEQFFTASRLAHGSDFEAFYDNYRRIMHWMQMTAPQGGAAANTFTEFGNTNQRFGIFYPGVGSVTTDVGVLASKMSDADKAARQMVVAMAEVLKIYYAFYVSDINGHMAYTEAFQARYGGTFTPKWESQQELFKIWDSRLKALANTLKAGAANQVNMTSFDQYYGGNNTRWAKAANALRMRIAMRLLKRDAATATAILKECVGDPTLLMSSNDDSWVYTVHNSFTAGGNWNPEGFRAPAPTVNFMWDTQDPRIRLFYQRNNYTQANITSAISANLLAAGSTEPARRFVGAPISPDVAQNAANRTMFTGRRVNASLTLDTISYIQYRLWQPTFGGGDGQTFFPLVTYADQQLMRAECAARGITSENAETLYNDGVTASINFYSQRAGLAKVVDYVAVTPAEITAYLSHPTVKYSASKALEQIAIQAYINFFKHPNEAWANWKRTGMPNKNTALANEDILINGSVYQIARRAVIGNPNPTDLNYVNKMAALEDMKKDSEFGSDNLDPLGRIWWDKR